MKQSTDRARGSLAGLAVGDALGGPAEGMEPAEIAARWGRIEGYVLDIPMGSDDTEYALLTARALLRFSSDFTSHNIARLWRDEVCGQEGAFGGGGFSEMSAINNLALGMDPPRSGQHSHSWSDGLAMRVAPIGIACGGDPDRASALAAQDGAVSHSGEGIYCGQAVAAAIAVALDGASAQQAYEAAMRAVPPDSWTGRNLRDVAAIASSSNDWASVAHRAVERFAVPTYYWADLGPEAVALAFVAVLGGGNDFRETILNAVNMGRDADTIAAIAGGIAGAISGLSSIPEEWLPAVMEAPGVCLRVTVGMHPLAVADELLTLAGRN